MEAKLWEALREVLDPEYPVSVVDLGLVRGVAYEGGKAKVRLTFTSLGCPCTEIIKEDIRSRLRQVEGVEEVEIEEVFEPWSAEDISPTGRLILLQLGVT
ncbi:metal-sulfur cluster assembly factor [Thermus scotoductus]|jgi:metal-sulfur cluster biosynthetic enzyme|uniref:Benzoyl-CoA oxygenase n=1 Tax=Thermus scotoductus TaxID=37636 RepID=A0A430RQM6_THESC|nr:metal-sulfur cluster assembly factor [Thermus scotoductus]RTG99771.1 benzoyl-CoA oxygenase [Thermus scotoductus]RTH21460.1 benzoyl-CoA oxygenase [Thermus scotoductus]RTI40557.1 benzoyl-CoA oxygenase [Thermus scotoductus]